MAEERRKLEEQWEAGGGNYYSKDQGRVACHEGRRAIKVGSDGIVTQLHSEGEGRSPKKRGLQGQEEGLRHKEEEEN